MDLDIQRLAWIAALRGRRLVLVEDDELHRLLLLAWLADSAGMQVLSADGGAPALARLAAEQVDLVLTDLQLPDMHGLALAAAIRRLPACRDTPVVAMTSHVAGRERLPWRDSGIAQLLEKPLAEDSLLQALASCLDAVPPGSTDRPVTAAEPRAAAEPVLLSPELGLQRCFGRTDLYARVRARYLASGPLTFEQMRGAWVEGQVARASVMAHSLVSTASSLGADPLAACARELHDALESGLPAAALFDRLAQLTGSVAEQLRAIDPSTGG